MADATKKRPRTARQLETLRRHAVKPGEVRNPTGVNGFTAARRFRDAFEAAASDKDLARIARVLIRGAGRSKRTELALVTERLWPKTERHELGSIGDVDEHERESAAARLQQLIDRGKS